MKVIKQKPTGTALGFVTRTCCGPDGEGECIARAEGFPCGIGEVPVYAEPETLLKNVGDSLRACRVGFGLTLSALAAELGISIVELSALEQGLAMTDGWKEILEFFARRIEEKQRPAPNAFLHLQQFAPRQEKSMEPKIKSEKYTEADPSPQKSFSPGDLVKLRSGGPTMTISTISPDGSFAECWMFMPAKPSEAPFFAMSVRGKFVIETFPTAVLEALKSG